jgi:hypothetical protein
MFSRKKPAEPALRPNPATVAAVFRSALVELVDEALRNHVRDFMLVEALDAQIARLRMAAASRPPY